MLHEAASDNVFTEFTTYAGQRYWWILVDNSSVHACLPSCIQDIRWHVSIRIGKNLKGFFMFMAVLTRGRFDSGTFCLAPA